MASLKRKLCLILFISYIKAITPKFLTSSSFDNFSFIYETLEDVINRCFRNNLNSLVVTKEISQRLQHFYNPNYPKAMILVNDSFQSDNYYKHYPKLVTFVLAANSVHQLEHTLTVLNSSIWWNINSNYILVRSGDSCSNASAMLNVTWNNKLLSIIFLCYESQENAVMLYTYNPFTNRAPLPWTVAENNDKPGDAWTLFKRPYRTDQSSCVNLIYDKSKFMDGYKLNCMGIPKPGAVWSHNQSYDVSTILDKVTTRDAKFFQTLFQVWNVSTNIHYNSTLYYMKRNYYHLLLSPLYMTTWDTDLVVPIYPFQQVSLVILTQKRPFLSPEEKIMSFYSFGVISMSTASFGIAIIALMLNKRQRPSSAVLEIMRILVSCGIEQPLNSTSIRIFLFGIFWLTTIINATFQGNLATFLTKPERISIETLADLNEYKYDVYMYPQYYNNFQGSFSLVNKSLKLTLLVNGYEYVVNNFRAAYIISASRGYGPAFKHQLHVSKPFLSDYISVATIKRFPFTSRINEIAFRCFESGFTGLWESQAVYDFKNNLTNTEALETAPRFRPISLSDLSFAFKLLGFGLGCSFVVFVIEIASRYYNKI